MNKEWKNIFTISSKSEIIPIFIDTQPNCQYYEPITHGCQVYGSCQCQNCPNYIKK